MQTHNFIRRFYVLAIVLGGLMLTIESCKKDTNCPALNCNTGVQNEGTCDCDCPEGFSGTNCEIQDTPLKVRKNTKDMTSEEINDFVNAVLTLKATPSPYSDTLSYYDTFVRFHQMAVEKTICTSKGVAHTNPAFPPWHRKLLILFEDALSEVSGKDIALPYWDWTSQESTDATFFLHHCNVDRIWAQWQGMPGNADSYAPVSGQADGYNLNDNMYPYDISEFQAVPAMTAHGDTPASMLDYRALGYKYE